jgi:hypothetical protein
MAYANWLKVNPTTGSGNKTVNVSSNAAHTGRNSRTTVLTISAANVASKTVNVTQQGKPQYVDSQDTASAAKGGQTITISGMANSKKLTFTLGTGNLSITLPNKYTAGGVETNNGNEISGDPGATAEYNWGIVITVPVNASTGELTRQLIVTDESGNEDTCLITQTAGDATLTVSKTSLELTYQGTAVSFDITSNTSWTIS